MSFFEVVITNEDYRLLQAIVRSLAGYACSSVRLKQLLRCVREIPYAARVIINVPRTKNVVHLPVDVTTDAPNQRIKLLLLAHNSATAAFI